jgi:lipopolysaccharide transport system ATP-binding protein
MSEGVAVSCQGVSKSFALLDGGKAWRIVFGSHTNVPAFKALENVSFEVPKGQFVGILGRNGAGKSTLLRVTGGVYPPDAGKVAIDGALSSLYELGLVANPELTGRQYAERVLKVHAFSASERKVMLDDIQEFSELGDRFEDPVLTYSAGMGARLYFSVATAGRYAVYLLDEVLSVGDMHFQSKCWRRLRDRIGAGASGVLVTHDWVSIVKLCETAYVLDHGRVIYSGPAERAARFYLYGETARERFKEGIVRFVGRPEYCETIETGADFHLSTEAEILSPVDVVLGVVFERLQPGFGWETAVMTRKLVSVGTKPGHYRIAVSLPKLPMEPGSYQISLQLVVADTENSDRYVMADSFGWLSGTGLHLEVTGHPEQGLALPSSWSVEAR